MGARARSERNHGVLWGRQDRDRGPVCSDKEPPEGEPGRIGVGRRWATKAKGIRSPVDSAFPL